MTESRTTDRLDIAETLNRYAEAVDIIGANPIQTGDPDPGLVRAKAVLKSCMTEDVKVRLFFNGSDSEPAMAGPGGIEEFGDFIRAYFTAYGYVQTYHLVGNIRTDFQNNDSVIVKSYINSNHWMADGRFLSAPIEYIDLLVRSADGIWRIATRDIVVWRWWVADGYTPDSGDPTLSRPK